MLYSLKLQLHVIYLTQYILELRSEIRRIRIYQNYVLKWKERIKTMLFKYYIVKGCVSRNGSRFYRVHESFLLLY